MSVVCDCIKTTADSNCKYNNVIFLNINNISSNIHSEDTCSSICSNILKSDNSTLDKSIICNLSKWNLG